MTTLKSISILYTSLIVKVFSIHRLANISGETLPCYVAVPSFKRQKYHLIESYLSTSPISDITSRISRFNLGLDLVLLYQDSKLSTPVSTLDAL